MSVQVENLEKNMAKLTIEVSAEDLEKALESAYQKQKKQISVPGFRKGKVPRAMIEKMYGVDVFYEDAANALMQQNYAAAVDESGIDIVSRPTVDVVQIEKGKPFIFTAEVAVKPEVTLGKYMGVTVTKIDTSVSDEEVDEALEKERNNNARTINVTDRPVAQGDTAVIDFEGFVDGVAFEGGKGENHSLEIGSHTFIDTFEDQLVGKNVGDEVDVNVTFPEQYQAADLAGKPATFKVKINEIKAKELPELDDEFAKDVSEFDTLAEYKESLKKDLEKKKQDEAKRTKEDEAIQKIIDKSKMEIPEAMIDTQCETMIEEFAQRIAQSGLSMDQYLQFSGLTVDGLKEQVRPEALTRIQSSLVLEQIAKEENIEVSDADVDAEIEKMAKNYGMEADKLKEYMGEGEKESMKRELAITKAVELIMDNIKERAKAKTKKEKEAETAAAAKVAEEKRLAEEAKKAAAAAAPAAAAPSKLLTLTHNEAEGRWDLVVPKSANGTYKVTIGAEGGECWFGVYQDKKLVHNAQLKSGETRDYEVPYPFKVSVGNRAKGFVKVDGAPVDLNINNRATSTVFTLVQK